MNPKVSIITINYNNPQITCEFLESTKNLTYKNFEVIVVDNASTKGDTNIITQKYPEVKLVKSSENLGFAGGNNLGISNAKGDYYFIVNNDTEVKGDLIEKLIEPFYREENIGIVCPKIKFYSNPEIIQYAGFQPINPFTGRTGAIGSLQIDNGQYNNSYFTNGAHGAAMMVSKRIIESVGLMPEMYFLYYEEWDWSTRIINAGFNILYNGKAEILHKESISTGKNSTLKTHYHIRNRILYMRRNVNFFQLIIFYAHLLFLIIPKSLMKFIIGRQTEHIIPFFRGIFWNVTTSKVN